MGNMFNLFGAGGGKSEGIYIWKKYSDSIKADFIGYVVSDDETKYPDKAEQDGFYYEKVELTLDAFGCTKFETGSFVTTSTATSKTVSHSMGVMPKFAFVWTEKYDRKLSAYVAAFTTSGTVGATIVYDSYANQKVVGTSGDVKATTNSCIFTTISSSTYYFASSTEYKYILLG